MMKPINILERIYRLEAQGGTSDQVLEQIRNMLISACKMSKQEAEKLRCKMIDEWEETERKQK